MDDDPGKVFLSPPLLNGEMPPQHITDAFEHAIRRVVTSVLIFRTVVADVAQGNQGLSGEGGRGGVRYTRCFAK